MTLIPHSKERGGNPGWGVHGSLGPKKAPQQKQQKQPKPHGPKGKPGGGGGDWLSRQPPGFLTGPVSGRQALKEINAATNLQYRPLERTIQGDLAGSQQRQADIPGWFQQYQNVLQNSANTTANAYAQAQQQLSDRMAQAGTMDAANQAQIQQRGQADAALRGVTAPTQGAQDAAGAAGARQALQASSGGLMGTLGANAANYFADAQRIGAGAQIAALQKEQQNEAGVRSDLRELASKEGDFATKYLSDLRQQERQYSLGQQTIGGENKRAQLSASTSRRGQNITAQDNKRTTATSRANNANTTSNSAASRRAQNIRDQKNRRERIWAHNHPQASSHGKTKPKKPHG